MEIKRLTELLNEKKYAQIIREEAEREATID